MLTEKLHDFLQLVTQPVLALEKGATVGWNPALEKRFPGVRIGMNISELIPGVESEGMGKLVSSPEGEFTVSETEGTVLCFFRDGGEDVHPFYAALGEELRGQIATIVNFRSMEEQKKDIFGTEEQWKFDAMLNRSLYRLIRTADNLTFLGEQEIYTDKRLLELSELTEETVRKAEGASGRKLRTEIPAGQRYLVEADRELLERMLLNLLANSLRYGGEKEITVSLRASKKNVLLCVRDDGVIPEEKFSTLFCGGVPKKKEMTGEKGFGFGLSVVDRIARLHGGTVSVESRKGKGTAVTVSLPIQEDRTLVLRDIDEEYMVRGLNPVLVELCEVLDWRSYKYLHGD